MSAGGLNASATSGLSASMLSQLEKLNDPTPPAPDQGADTLSALASAQGLLGFGGGNHLTGAGSPGLGGSALYNRQAAGSNRQAAGATPPNMETAGVSDALSLLTRAIPRGDGSNHGFGGVPDRQDGGDRYNNKGL
jgi:hypothetical protein